MDDRRARIHDDLRGLIEGDLLFSAIERAPYALDASLYEIDPLGVVLPRHEEDLAALVRYAADQAIPLHPRGAGTSMAGETLGEGLVVDFSRHFRRVVEVKGDRVTVQPGVVLNVLNSQLAPIGRRIGPDPSGPESRTVGGMIGADAAGVQSLRFGTMAGAVESLRVMFSNGEIATLGPEPWPVFGYDEPVDFKENLLRKLGTLYRHHGESFARAQPKSPRNRAGYAFDRATNPAGIDLARLIVGSEGTLALVLEATLRTVPIPTAQGVVVLPFGRLADAAAVVADTLPYGPSACELFDWRSLSLARDAVPAYRCWLPESAEAALIVQFDGDDPDDIRDRVNRLVRRVERLVGLVAEPHHATRRADCEPILNLRRVIKPLLMRMEGPIRPLAFIEDVAVPPEALPAFLGRLENIMKRHDVSWTLYAHAGHGQIHARPFLDLGNPLDVAKLEPVATEVYEAALGHGGTISGEHGCGLVRTQFLRRQYGDAVHVFREIKDAFDPENMLNPGKVVGDDPHLMMRSLRRMPPKEEVEEEGPPEPSRLILPVLETNLRWGDSNPWEVAASCNGCGACRTQDLSMRMCPSFRASKVETASPRAQANMLRQIAAGVVDPRLWGTEEVKKHADLCIHCNLCAQECPSAIDVSSLMMEAKAAYVQNHGLPPIDWVLSRIELWSAIASRFPILSNALLGSRWARWLIERTTGLSRLRRIPRAHRTPFVVRAERLGLTKAKPQEQGPRVAYFVDIFANYFDQELAESVVAVLRHAGVNVFVPRRQKGSGMASLVAGDLDHARELAATNLRILSSAIRDGYTVVCSEPTAALMLQRYYLKLTDDLDASLVAANTMDVGQYLLGLQQRGQLPTPEHPVHARLGYHQPCHLRGQNVGMPGVELMKLIPDLDVQVIDRGCSGMAGTFGMASKNFRTSLRAGRELINRLRDDDIEFGATECGACRIQMEQGVAKRTLHPIKVLSLAYGMSPSLQAKLKSPKRKHTLS